MLTFGNDYTYKLNFFNFWIFYRSCLKDNKKNVGKKIILNDFNLFLYSYV